MLNNTEHPDKNFDTWLAASLREASVSANPQFTRRVLRDIENYQARQLLQKVMLQKKILGWLCVLTIAISAGIMLTPPISMSIYAFLVEGFKNIIVFFMRPIQMNWGLILYVGICAVLSIQHIWDNFRSET